MKDNSIAVHVKNSQGLKLFQQQKVYDPVLIYRHRKKIITGTGVVQIETVYLLLLMETASLISRFIVIVHSI